MKMRWQAIGKPTFHQIKIRQILDDWFKTEVMAQFCQENQMVICQSLFAFIEPNNGILQKLEKLGLWMLMPEDLIQDFIQEHGNGTLYDVEGNAFERRKLLGFLDSLQVVVFLVIDHHFQQVEWLEHIERDFGFWFSSTVDQVRLQAKQLRINLSYDATFGVIGNF